MKNHEGSGLSKPDTQSELIKLKLIVESIYDR